MERPRIGLAVTAGLSALALVTWSCVGDGVTRTDREEPPAVEPEPSAREDDPSAGEDDPASTGDEPADDPTDEPSDDPSPAVDTRLEGLIEVAVEDLSERLGVTPGDITVVSAEMVVWSDPSLGCPQPGMRYEQVPQDGAEVLLEHDGRSYAYHAGGDRPEPFLCEPAPRDPDAPRDLDPDLPRDLEPDVPPPGGDLDI